MWPDTSICTANRSSKDSRVGSHLGIENWLSFELGGAGINGLIPRCGNLDEMVFEIVQ